MEVRKQFYVGLYPGGRTLGGGGLIFRESFGLTGDLCIPTIHHSVSNQRDY